jgi:hypothetical protein
MVEGLPSATLRGRNFKMKEAAGVYVMSLNRKSVSKLSKIKEVAT